MAMASVPVDEFFRAAPASLDVEKIYRAWLSLGAAYDVNAWKLPLPPWALRGYTDPGARAWETLQADLARADPKRPMCLYLHIPFCSSKCGFCDSYSFKLGAHQAEHMDRYLARLTGELEQWSAEGSLRERPVSTVHLGGGTPTFLGPARLTLLVEVCRALLSVSAATEWALESTVESLSSEMIDTLDGLGFRRLHIGVQSLQPEVRRRIGRRCTREQTLDTLQSALARGWVVTVDLVCGLPGQTLVGWLDDLQTLVDVGIDGFSLYELLIYPQNRGWAESYGLVHRDHLPNYWMFQAGAQWLAARGFGKNLFNHWAGPRDKNVYFTFPARGEDCLAVGTIADGVFGDYHYRHPRYAAYLSSARGDPPVLEGGVRRTAAEARLLPLRTAVLSGALGPTIVAQLGARDGSKEPLLGHWQVHGLVEPVAGGGLTLTASGAWFAGNLVQELAAVIEL